MHSGARSAAREPDVFVPAFQTMMQELADFQAHAIEKAILSLLYDENLAFARDDEIFASRDKCHEWPRGELHAGATELMFIRGLAVFHESRLQPILDTVSQALDTEVSSEGLIRAFPNAMAYRMFLSDLRNYRASEQLTEESANLQRIKIKMDTATILKKGFILYHRLQESDQKLQAVPSTVDSVEELAEFLFSKDVEIKKIFEDWRDFKSSAQFVEVYEENLVELVEAFESEQGRVIELLEDLKSWIENKVYLAQLCLDIHDGREVLLEHKDWTIVRKLRNAIDHLTDHNRDDCWTWPEDKSIESLKFVKGFAALPSLADLSHSASELQVRIHAMKAEDLSYGTIETVRRELSNLSNFHSSLMEIEQKKTHLQDEYPFYSQYDSMKSQIDLLLQEMNTRTECEKIKAGIAQVRESARINVLALQEEFKRSLSQQKAAMFRMQELDTKAIPMVESLRTEIDLLRISNHTNTRSLALIEQVETLFRQLTADIQACVALIHENAPRLRLRH